MSNSNKHIEEFLDYYLNVEQSPDYAVLITGCWGSGKTYFIRKYLEGKGAAGKDVVKTFDWLTDCEKYAVVYVSLFGAKSREEMDKRVLEKLHPILNSEYLKSIPTAVSTIAKLLKEYSVNPALKATGAVAEIATPFLAEVLPNIIKGEGEKLKGAVVVFDDVERADMPLPELLGYLNEYVEHLHVPCILLADKDKWEEAQKCQEDKSTLHHLSSTKEKVIGKEFQIQTSFDEVWNLWFNQETHLLGDKAWRLLKDYHDVIAQVFELSKTSNYRSLRHAFFDFQQFIENIQDEYLTNPEFNSLFIADFIAHQYAYCLGWFNASEYAESNAFRRGFAKGFAENRNRGLAQDESADEELYKKYPKLPYEKFEEIFDKVKRLSSYTFLDDYYAKWRQIWKEWFSRNYIDPEHLNDVIRNSIWYDKKDDYYLNKMYEWFGEDDDSGPKAMAALEKALQDKKLTSPISIMCLFSKLYWLAQRRVFVEDYNAFCKKIEDYVAVNKDVLEYEDVDEWTQHTMVDSSYNCVKKELDHLQELLKKILAKKAVSFKQNKMDEFFDNLGNENPVFSEHTCDTIINGYLDERTFAFGDLDAGRFCEAYRKMPSQVKTKCFNALKSRYHYHPEQIKREKNFLEKLLKSAQKIFNDAKRPLLPSEFAFDYLIRSLEEILGVKNDAA